jgi:hypothetical protein
MPVRGRCAGSLPEPEDAGDGADPAVSGRVIFAPAGALVPEVLSHAVPGGVAVCAGIYKAHS